MSRKSAIVKFDFLLFYHDLNFGGNYPFYYCYYVSIYGHGFFAGGGGEGKKEKTRQVSSMIHPARPIVTPVANIVFCCFDVLDLKSETDGRTDNMCENDDPYRP